MKTSIIVYLVVLLSQAPILWAGADVFGHWTTEIDGRQMELVLNQDNTGSLAGQTFAFAIQGEWMLLQYADGSMEQVGWRLQGDTLTVQLEDGTVLNFTRAGAGSAPAVESPAEPPADASASPADFYFMKRGNNVLTLCAYNPANHQVKDIKQYTVAAVEPARRGEDFVFAVKDASRPSIMGRIAGKHIHIKMPPDMSIEVRHPSISRDGKLLAFCVKSNKHVGNIDLLNYSTGAYEGTYTAIGSWYKIIGINLQTGKQQAIYYDDALVPDVMKQRGLGPVYSPAQDIVAHGNNYRITLSDSTSGKELKKLEVPTIQSGGWTGKALISEYSGLAFSPDGRYVAYLSQGEADISVSPHLLVLIDITTGRGSFMEIPDGYSAYSPLGLITLDFSPDGRYLVFSANRDNQDPQATFMMVADLQAGSFHLMQNSLYGISAVWKGR